MQDVVWMGETRNRRGILVGKSIGKQPLESSRKEWENDIKMDAGFGHMDGIKLLLLVLISCFNSPNHRL
jgi:hypothetical protein